MQDTQKTAEQNSGLGKLIAVGGVLLLPVIALALLMPAVQSARQSAMKKSLEYGSRGELEETLSEADEATEQQTPTGPALPRAIVKKYDAEISLTPKLSIGTATPESIYVADFKASIEAMAHNPENENANDQRRRNVMECSQPICP